MLWFGDVFRLILFGNLLNVGVMAQYVSDARRSFNEAFGHFLQSETQHSATYYSNDAQQYHQERPSFYGANAGYSAPSFNYQPRVMAQHQPLMLPQLPPVSAAGFPDTQSSTLLSKPHSVLTPDITHRRLTGSLFQNYGDKRIARVTVDDDNNNDDNNNDDNNNNKNNSNDSDDNSVDASGEWVFNPNSRRLGSNEWEFSGTKTSRRHGAIDTPTDANNLRRGAHGGAVDVHSSDMRRALCMSPGCRTWITISIPDRSIGRVGGSSDGINAVEGSITTTYETKQSRKGIGSTLINGSGHSQSTDTGGKSSGSSSLSGSLPKSEQVIKNRPASIGSILPTSSTPARLKITAATSPTPPYKEATRRLPSEFVFSTSWILSLKRVTLPTQSGSVTTNAPSTQSSVDSASGNEELVRSYTLKPKASTTSGSPVTSVTSSPSASGDGGDGSEKSVTAAGSLDGSNVGTSKKKSNKPWTHSSSGASRPSRKKSAKHRPVSATSALPPPNNGASNMEEAAIWASTELIDAIREALEKFRSALYRSGTNVHYADAVDSNTERDALTTRIERIFKKFKQGSWLERTLADAMLDDASLMSDATAGDATSRDTASMMLNAILPSLLSKLEDDPEHGISDLVAHNDKSGLGRRVKRDTRNWIARYDEPSKMERATQINSVTEQKNYGSEQNANNANKGTNDKVKSSTALSHRSSFSQSNKSGKKLSPGYQRKNISTSMRRKFNKIRMPKRMMPDRKSHKAKDSSTRRRLPFTKRPHIDIAQQA